MKSPFVSELEPDQPVAATFLVHNKEIRQKKSGEPYLSLTLGDRTGDLDAKMWDNVAEVMSTFERDDFVKVKGALQIFHNRPQLTIHKMQRVADADVDFADYFPASKRNLDEMLAEVRTIVAAVRNPHVRALLDSILDDPEIARRFKTAPAAKSIHHAWLGGLIEHVLSLCELCRMTASHYPFVDLDLLIAAAVLHDLGKIHELSYERGFGYTTEGQLIGHMNLALRIVADKLARLPEFPPRLRTLIEHLILSHHGRLEFGSPKVPQFAEALLFHYLDDLDSKMECTRSLLERDRLFGGDFSTYSASMDRSILKKDRYLNPEPAESPSPAKPQPPAQAPPPAQAKLGLLGEKLMGALTHKDT